MSKPKRDKPAVNYAKQIQSFTKKKEDVEKALSNQRMFFDNRDGRGADNGQGNERLSSLKIYEILHNKAQYQGEWKEGLPNGKGICMYQDGTYLEGNFTDGELNDKNAFIIFPNGAKYRGNVQGSQLQGEGRLEQGKQNSKYIYEGFWKNGKPHGLGIQKFADQSSYEGEFVDGVKHCFNEEKSIQQKKEYFKYNKKLSKQSTYISAKKETYKGQFKNGLMHGFGQYFQAENKMRYCGEFECGKKKGMGQFHTEDGILSGVFQNDVVNGKGTFIWKDQRRYDGNFKNNLFDGKGRIYMPNKTILEGVWVDGHNKQLRTIQRQL